MRIATTVPIEEREVLHNILSELLRFRSGWLHGARVAGETRHRDDQRFDSLLQPVIDALDVGVVLRDAKRGMVEHYAPNQPKRVHWMTHREWMAARKPLRSRDVVHIEKIPAGELAAAIKDAAPLAPALAKKLHPAPELL